MLIATTVSCCRTDPIVGTVQSPLVAITTFTLLPL